MKLFKRISLVAVALASAGALSLAGSPIAGAQTESGWIGPTFPVAGTIYLNQSTISNSPLSASTRVWTAFANNVPANSMMVQSRLFKSGALCVINPYKVNTTAAASLGDGTTGDCGEGSYNSHGFVYLKDGQNWVNYATFPTNPLNYPEATAADSPESQKVQTNSKGQTYGSAEFAESFDQQPDLILAYGTDGSLGYIQKSDLTTPSNSEVSATSRTGKNAPLYSSEGDLQGSSFTVGSR